MTSTVTETATLTHAPARGLLETLAAHCSAASDTSVAGSRSVARAKECVLDFASLALGGTRTDVGRMAIRSRARARGASSADSGCTAIGVANRIAPGDAAALNGLLGHALQCDDGMRRAHGHPGIAVIPASLAAAQVAGTDGAAFLRAVIAGYEVFARVGAALNPAHLSTGFHPSGTVGALAAAAGASVLLAPGDATVQQNAIALAGSVAGGLMEYSHFGDMSSYFVGGNAARVGLDAALLAAEGMTGPLTVLEGRFGMAATMSDGTLHRADLIEPDDEPGILQTYTKLYPACRHTHSAIEAALFLRNDLVDDEEVAGVDIEIYRLAVDECHRPDAHTLAGAETSLELTVAAALVFGEFSLESRSLARFTDPRVRSLASRVTVRHAPEFDSALPDERPARVTLTTATGAHLRAQVDLPRGEPERPLSWREIVTKARLASGDAMDHESSGRLVAAVQSLDSAADLNELTDCFEVEPSTDEVGSSSHVNVPNRTAGALTHR